MDDYATQDQVVSRVVQSSATAALEKLGFNSYQVLVPIRIDLLISLRVSLFSGYVVVVVGWARGFLKWVPRHPDN